MGENQYETIIKQLLDTASMSDSLRKIAATIPLTSSMDSFFDELSDTESEDPHQKDLDPLFTDIESMSRFDVAGYDSEQKKEAVLGKLNNLGLLVAERKPFNYNHLSIVSNATIMVKKGYALTHEMTEILNEIYNS